MMGSTADCACLHAIGGAMNLNCVLTGLEHNDTRQSWMSPCHITMDRVSCLLNRVMVRVYSTRSAAIDDSVNGGAVGGGIAITSPLPIHHITIRSGQFRVNSVLSGGAIGEMDWPVWLPSLPWNRGVASGGGAISINHYMDTLPVVSSSSSSSSCAANVTSSHVNIDDTSFHVSRVMASSSDASHPSLVLAGGALWIRAVNISITHTWFISSQIFLQLQPSTSG